MATRRLPRRGSGSGLYRRPRAGHPRHPGPRAGIPRVTGKKCGPGLCVSASHADFMARAFSERGLPAALSGEVDSAERNRLGWLRSSAARSAACSASTSSAKELMSRRSTPFSCCDRTQSATVLTQQIGRGLRQHSEKTTLTVVDLIGQQHRKFRFDTKLRALIDPRNGRLVDQADQGFPYLPAGCEINLDRMSREVVLSSLRAAAGSRMWPVLVDDLRGLGDVDLATFLRNTDRLRPTCTGIGSGRGLASAATRASRLHAGTSSRPGSCGRCIV